MRKLAQYDEMEQKVQQTEQIKTEKEQYQRMLGDLYDNGVIKQDGDGSFIHVEDPAERESIKSKSKQR
jgi:hypothetical protein